jgi:DNA (cytosine-5)-methyltransferase 3A
MNVLSLFDGMSCGQIALNRININIDNYFSSEIEVPSINVTMNNYPNTIQLGDVCKVDGYRLPKIDLLIGGSPCQDISNLNKFKLGLDGEKSGLFYQYYRLLQEVKPKYFLLENVNGNKKAIQDISLLLGVKPIRLDSRLVSAQTRDRLYWTNILVMDIPKNKHLGLVDILQDDVDEKYYLSGSRRKWLCGDAGISSIRKSFSYLDPPKAGCLTKRGDASWNCTYITEKDSRIRKLTPIEWERLQTVPDNYTSCVEDRYRYEMLGNGWTVDIIAHIFKYMKLD